ncbi:hypothetical protein [Photobacterium lutimaris]|uniref:TrfB transcriptional repressor protein domain-containing protein n=1 Tax=Photobacterium lutimaris TaxID=388278 RepID=A0A2T3ITR7_9GAMM|nr:hypothetical protein [Photobacterium lutimaris]PSU31731.1 hypothetical protein C9I99_21330 [Photobacterium lutimaris]TDR72629.1 hypothetical protein DFP78_113105 [Photobacterium lutimaris]
MTIDELELINKIIRGQRESIAYKAAKLVLVEGRSQTEATVILNAKKSAIQNGVTRYSNWDAEIKNAYKVTK